MHGRSEHDPTINPSVRNPPRNRGYLSRSTRAFCMENPTFRAPAIIPTIQISPNAAPATKSDNWTSSLMIESCHIWNVFTLRGAAGVTPQHHQTHLLRKMALMIHYWSPSHICKVIYVAGSSMQESPSMATSPNTVRPREMTFQNLMEIFWQRLKCHLQCADPRPFRAWSKHAIRAWTRQSATRRATEVTFRASHADFVWKNTAFRAPTIIPNFTKCCPCHDKWHLNFTKFCTCHENWMCNLNATHQI